MALLTAVIFLIVTSACSHAPRKPSSPNPREISSSEESRPASSAFQEESWWKKDENQWLVAFLIVLGIGIAIGATIYIASGANGLTLAVKK